MHGSVVRMERVRQRVVVMGIDMFHYSACDWSAVKKALDIGRCYFKLEM